MKASEVSLGAPEGILEASGSCLLDDVKNLDFPKFFDDFRGPGCLWALILEIKITKKEGLGAYHEHKIALGSILRSLGSS